MEQVLQQGIAAHNAGNLREAERAYQTILQSQPQHPDANHNLGLIAISADQVAIALPLFKTAIDVNPTIEQFWISYIDALVKANQLKGAKSAIKKAKKSGMNAKKLQALLSPSKGVTTTKAPSQAQLNSLLEHYQAGRFREAEKLAKSISQEFPKHQSSWKVLGAIFGQTGRKSEAVHANEIAVAISPQDSEAHINLGNTLKELGRLDEAEASYKQAIASKPDYAEAHYNLGNTLKELGRLEEAEASYKQAIACKPDYAKAHNDLGVILKELGRIVEFDPISGNVTKTYDKFFEEKQLITIHSYLNCPKWTNQKSNLDDDSSFAMYEVSDLDYFKNDLLDHINSKTDSDFLLERIYFNGQDYGQNGEWHLDNDIGYTHLTYLNIDAVPDWGGETELKEAQGIIKQIAPQYNSSVIFKGSILHRGLSFKYKDTPKRITLAFKLIPKTRVFGEVITT